MNLAYPSSKYQSSPVDMNDVANTTNKHGDASVIIKNGLDDWTCYYRGQQPSGFIYKGGFSRGINHGKDVSQPVPRVDMKKAVNTLA